MEQHRPRGRPPFPDVLTAAEWQVAEAVRHGLSNRAIAERQGVSVDAVKYHVANILQKLGLPTRRDVRRWAGIRRDSNLSGKVDRMAEGFQLGRIGQIARSVADVVTAERWYRDVLGLKHLFSFGKISFFDCDGTRLFLSEGDGAANSILYFQVPDIHAAHRELAGRGVEFINAPHMIHRHADGTEEWMAFFNDNEGRPLAIIAQACAAM